jgi:hypothetical protein
MADDGRIQVQIDFSAMVFPDTVDAVHAAVEEDDGFKAVDGEPVEERGAGLPDALVITLVIVGAISDALELKDRAVQTARRVANTIKQRKQGRASTGPVVVKTIYGPTGEELSRVEVPAKDED